MIGQHWRRRHLNRLCQALLYEPSLDWKERIHVKLADSDLRFDLARTEYEVILGRPELQIQYHLTKATGARLLALEPADGSS